MHTIITDKNIRAVRSGKAAGIIRIVTGNPVKYSCGTITRSNLPPVSVRSTNIRLMA